MQPYFEYNRLRLSFIATNILNLEMLLNSEEIAFNSAIGCLALLVHFMRQEESNFAQSLLPTVLFSVALAFFASVIAMGCYYLLTHFFMELRT